MCVCLCVFVCVCVCVCVCVTKVGLDSQVQGGGRGVVGHGDDPLHREDQGNHMTLKQL